ncbi:pseudouridine synthase, partial [Calocera cornea HHB12733]
KYEDWTRTQLIARLSQLDDDTGVARPRRKLGFDISSKPRRKIALKFCYHGWEYSGLELQKGHSVFPTVESVLEAALIGARLIDPAGGLEGAELSKSGRTDRGVSAAGQVISLWVRTTQHLLSTESEIPYAATLNRLLPPSIRILSWSPVTSDFKARFACIGRHYKYFFRLHSGLDLGRMRDAAQRLEGTHDWRNFCKLDGSKGDVNYLRTVDLATIDHPALYVINVRGLGFLYHQIRHIAAVLFLVGQGLEEPSIVTSLLNTDPANPIPPFRADEPPPAVLENKPVYEIADPLPLVLWDTLYRDEDVRWQ